MKRYPILRIRKFWYRVGLASILMLCGFSVMNWATEHVIIDGVSMSPTVEVGQYLIVNRTSYVLDQPQRGDIVVFDSPIDSQRKFVKRIIGLPGETLEFRSTQVFIDGYLLEESYLIEACHQRACGDGIWQIGQDEYFTMGDNRNRSHDSRLFGTILSRDIIGKALIIYYPFSEVKWLS